MNCAACDKTLQTREHAQPMTINGTRRWPKSLCDNCAKANQWEPGSHDALHRLTTGTVDPNEAARIAELTPLHLTEAARAHAAVIDEARAAALAGRAWRDVEGALRARAAQHTEGQALEDLIDAAGDAYRAAALAA